MRISAFLVPAKPQQPLAVTVGGLSALRKSHSSESMESDDAGHAWGEVRKPEFPPDGRETTPGPAGHLKDPVQESHTSAHGGTTATGLGQPRVRLESSRTFTPESAGATHGWESLRQVLLTTPTR